MSEVLTAAEAEGTLVDRLLEEQRTLRPVERFAVRHESGRVPETTYRDRIPLSRPGEGQQYAFEVDLDKCTGCKACVSACHSLNGLEERETWRDVGAIHGDFAGVGYQQTVTTACHHCADPACANGCPVLAYEKDPETGIVRHLDDQCIGCQYCSLKCPYDVPKYSKSKGIVRKCDMCQSRLEVGEAPACVQACPTEAIRIVTVEKEGAVAEPDERLVPGTVESGYTRPTTRYVTGREVPSDARPADDGTARLEHAHFPLVAMLTLTQAGVGLMLGALLGGRTPIDLAGIRLPVALEAAAPVGWIGFVLLMLGLGASVLHLGQPLKAWRVFLGLRKSWLSREVVSFGMLPPLGLGALLLPGWIGLVVAAVALGCVFTSVMVYADTRRALWRFPRSAGRFFGTVAIFVGLGAAGAGVPAGIAVALLALGAKLVGEVLYLRAAARLPGSHDAMTAGLTLGPLRRVAILRVGLAVVAAILAAAGLVGPAGALLLLSEGCERYQFFAAVVAHRMPGG